MSADVTTRIDVRDPAVGEAGCVSARVGGEFGPEICYAVGREYGDWYVSLYEILFDAAGIEPQQIHIVAGRREAEDLVRLFAALYAQIASAA